MPAVAGVLLFVLAVLVMIVAHEAGHFITAKAFGIKVEEFFIGFGPRLWSFRRGETEYGLKAVPAGGYVRIAGMNPFQEPAPEDRPRTFGAKPPWQRAIVLVAGALTHFVLALLILVVFFAAVGMPRAMVVDVDLLLDGGRSPASAAGLREGDEILEVDGRAVTWEGFLEETRSRPGDELVLTVGRSGERVAVRATPVRSELVEGGPEVGRLGIVVGEGGRLRSGGLEAVTRSGAEIGRMVVGSFRSMAQIFSPSGLARIVGQVFGGEARDVERDPAGIVGAARLSGQALEQGFSDWLFFLFAGFNVFVGVLNLLPLPPLDGGHLAVVAVEKVTGRRVDVRRLVPLTALVAGFLIVFMVSLLYLDIARPLQNPFQ